MRLIATATLAAIFIWFGIGRAMWGLVLAVAISALALGLAQLRREIEVAARHPHRSGSDPAGDALRMHPRER